MIYPKSLKSGDKIAVVSPSWGGPAKFSARYNKGKEQLEAALDVEIVEMPHTLAENEWLQANPQARARDLMLAFADPSIAGIIASIGGEDSVRLYPYLDMNIIRNNPKVFMGYSDTTALHLACYHCGLVSFYGPSIMAGFAENQGIHDYTLQSVKRTLFSNLPIGRIYPSPLWTQEHLDWGLESNQQIKRRMEPNAGWRVLNGTGKATGHMLGAA